MSKTRWTREKVVGYITEKHGDEYNTDKLVYSSYKEKFILTCKEHGDFKIDLCHLLRGQGCPKCRYIKSAKGKRRSVDEVVEAASAVHGGIYDYSLITEYKSDRIKYPIICKKHGVFYQTMNNHIKGKQGCPVCGREKCDEERKVTFEEFVQKAKKKHGNYYIYHEDSYNGISKLTRITCPQHGDFIQTGSNHVFGQGCPVCGNIRGGMKLRSTKEEFIEKARLVHGDKYDYSKVDYITVHDNITITCPKHGDFTQLPYNHLTGNGCPKCVPLESVEEKNIYEYVKNDLNFDDTVNRDRTILDGKELDVIVPSKNIAIEYDGLFWHNELNNRDSQFHLRKTKLCDKAGIRLIHIFEDEWLHKQDIVKSMLRNVLGKTENKIYARKCSISSVDPKEALEFLNKNHIQGKCHSTVKIGLYYNNELVSLMCFGQSRHFIGNHNGGEWELIRFCNKLNTNVVGGASRLFKYFVDTYNPKEIISYADRRWSNGQIYNVLGFEKYNESKPNYYYVIGTRRYYRFNFRKSILIKKYGCPKNMSEHEFCLAKKWYRIYDCGCLCYRWKNNENK